MTIYSRLRKVVNWLVFSELVESQNDLAARLGYSSSYMSQVMSSAKVASPSFVGKICSLDPNLSPEWVLEGVGQMFQNNPFSEFSGGAASPVPPPPSGDVVVDAAAWDVIKSQAQSLASRDRQVDELISMLREQLAEQKKRSALLDAPAKCADVG